ncbi:MAG TPA: peptidase MA family metallohydrolase [Herpetosiphonaceae bacterium]|nr:peptidase MA family metallohydrolase [Herpetosiphonaceae bacterium]
MSLRPKHPARSRRWIALLAVALLLLVAPGWARAADQATIARNEVSSDFGAEIRFELAATSPAEIKEVAFLYALGVSADDLPAYTEARPEWQPDGGNVEATFVRDTSIDYLPVGVTLRYKWVLTADDGTITETPEQSLQYQDTRFNWREKSDRGITVRWYDGGDDWGDALLRTATGALDRLEQRIGGTVDDPMTISIYKNTSDMRAALPPNSAEWIGGQARPDLGLIVGAIAEGDDAELGRLVPHELSHLVLHQATRNNYGGMPVWFDEGSAVANQDSPDFGFTDRVEDAARNGELIPLRALASNFPNDPDKALQSYAQSESVVRYIEKTYGVEAITRLVAQFKSGTTDDAAVESALGISIDDLDAAWRATLPAAERTPDPVAADDTAPADRFRDRPIQQGGGGASVVVSAGGLALPVWVWAVGGLGALLILVGGIWVFREARRG